MLHLVLKELRKNWVWDVSFASASSACLLCWRWTWDDAAVPCVIYYEYNIIFPVFLDLLCYFVWSPLSLFLVRCVSLRCLSQYFWFLLLCWDLCSLDVCLAFLCLFCVGFFWVVLFCFGRFYTFIHAIWRVNGVKIRNQI